MPDPIREYIYLGGTLLASLTFTTGAPVLTYYHTDMLGSVRAITNAVGATLLRYDFGPFGEGGSIQGDPRQFAGQERDGETALDYLKARYLKPVWGRFTQADDSAFMNPFEPQSLNPYAYVWNNPLRWVDPSGHDKCAAMFCVTTYANPPEPTALEYAWALYMNFQSRLADRQLNAIRAVGKEVDHQVGSVFVAITNTFVFGNAPSLEGTVTLATLPMGPLKPVGAVAGVGGRAAVSRGTAIIGKFPNYLKHADAIGARRFSVPAAHWNRMSATEQWAANQRFLDRAIARGDNILLSEPLRRIADATGGFRAELDYLVRQGYTLSADGTRMIR